MHKKNTPGADWRFCFSLQLSYWLQSFFLRHWNAERRICILLRYGAGEDRTEEKTEKTEETEQKEQELPEEQQEADARVNINTAGVEELMTLKGVGESRAQAIIAWRTEQGPFEKPEDIMQISGIKEGVYSRIKDQIRVH
ncbi:MAG: ComEA family DNA-binding protein [Lachnospiraceae bacterium]